MRLSRAFITLWTFAVIATASAFVLHLALRGKTVSLGYALGHARAEQARLREVKRVLQVESASYKTPERVEIVARTLLAMDPPAPSRVVSLSATPPPREGPSALGPTAGASVAAAAPSPGGKPAP